MADMNQYNNYLAKIRGKAKEAKEAIFYPILESEGAKDGIGSNGYRFISDPKARAEKLKAVTQDTIFEGVGQASTLLQADAANAMRAYINRTGQMPSDEMLASGMQAVENVMALYEGEGSPGGIFEAVPDSMTTTEGVIKRERQVALVFPLMFTMATADMVSWIPGTFNQAELFLIERRAGSTFGDVTKDDLLDPREYRGGQYTNFDQRYAVNDGDGTNVGGDASDTANYFQFDSNTVFYSGIGTDVQPFLRKSVKIFYQKSLVARDDGNGNITGSFKNDAGVTTAVTGSVDYTNGTVDPIFSVAPETTKEVHIGFDIDIEKDPTLIPSVHHTMIAAQVYPHQSAVTSDLTLQSYWEARREYNIDQRAMLLRGMTNLLAQDKDKRVLRDLYFYANGNVDWSRDVPAGAAYTPPEHYMSLKESLLEADHAMMERTGVAGVVGLVVPTAAAIIIQSIPEPHFQYVPGYRPQAQPHRVGRLFGRWDVTVDPHADTDYTCLLYGKGSNAPGQSAYNIGICIPPITFKHPVLSDLRYSTTMWGQDYRDINPFYNSKMGRDYLMTLTMTTSG